MSHQSYDQWKLATPPEYEFLGPEPEDEEEIEEPEIEELWDGAGAYIHVVTMRPSGRKFYIRQATSGAFVGDWEICGPNNFFSDGFLSPEKAIDWLVSRE